jgi:1-deoxy-D-xylulose-5-phosphate reductoisomerase
VDRLDLAAAGRFDFEPPDLDRFPALRIARAAMEEGGRAPIVLNAANEIAVAAFLQGSIHFSDIAAIVEQAIEKCEMSAPATIDEVMSIDRRTRIETERMIREPSC